MRGITLMSQKILSTNSKRSNRRRPRAEGSCNIACSRAWAAPPRRHRRALTASPTTSLRCRGQALENCYVEAIRPKRRLEQSQLLDLNISDSILKSKDCKLLFYSNVSLKREQQSAVRDRRATHGSPWSYTVRVSLDFARGCTEACVATRNYCKSADPVPQAKGHGCAATPL